MLLKRKYLLAILIFTLCIFTSTVQGKAMNTGFSTNELSKEEQESFISNINITLLTAEPAKKNILCFDVNESGLVAIGQVGSNRKVLCVYNAEGAFLYGYTFNCTGTFVAEWNSEYLNIYFVRSDVIISLDSDGNILDIKEVQNTIDNNAHNNTLLYSTSRIVGDTTYLVRNDMGIFNWVATSYSQIIAMDTNGVEHIIYDVPSPQPGEIVVSLIVILIFVSTTIASSIKKKVN